MQTAYVVLLFFCVAVVFDVYRDSQVTHYSIFIKADIDSAAFWISVTDNSFWVFLQGRVWLIDVNPFGEVTDALLFSWEQLTSSGEIGQHQVSRHPCSIPIDWFLSLYWAVTMSHCMRAGGPGFPLHHQRGDGAAQSLSELQNPAGLCWPLHWRGCLQAHWLPQTGRMFTNWFRI